MIGAHMKMKNANGAMPFWRFCAILERVRIQGGRWASLSVIFVSTADG